mmetsp:Transcript_16792/g.24483  ORF Transcript_16792/g.24483 Transcript_16792/m.24483 type:complete len:89 (-) Transcript_16792:468-734(-)
MWYVCCSKAGEAGVEEYLSNPGTYTRDADNEETKEESSGDENILDCKFDDGDNYATEMEDVDHSVHEQLYALGPEGRGVESWLSIFVS